MDDEKFTIDDAADLFGDEVIEEEIEPDPEEEIEPEIKITSKLKHGAMLVSEVEEHSESDDVDIMDIKDKALDILEKHKSIYKLTLQGILETEFPLVDKRMIRSAVDSLKDHPEVKWPHDMLLQKE